MAENPEPETACPPLLQVEITRCLHLEKAGQSEMLFHLSDDPERREYSIRLPEEFKETALVTEMLLLRKPDRKVRANFLRMEYGS